MAAASALAQLRKLLAHHEHITQAIRLTLSLVGDDAAAKTQRRAPDMLAQALALDRARTAGRATKKTKRKTYKTPNYQGAGAAKAKRQKTAALLATFDTQDARRPADSTGLSVLMQHGYLKKKGDGYVRTAKVFTP